MSRCISLVLMLSIAIPAIAATPLREDTATTIKVGPFSDPADSSAETSLTIQKADVRLSKNGGNMAAASADQGASDAGAAHDELGYYDIALDATDTSTVGSLKVMITESGALPVRQEFEVVPIAEFDSYEYAPDGGRIWFVAEAGDGGSDANPGTRALPLLTGQEAVDQAAEGHSIYFKTGTYDGQIVVPIDKPLHLYGDGNTSILTYETAAQYDPVLEVNADSSSVCKLRIVSTGSGQGFATSPGVSEDGYPVVVKNLLLEDVEIVGQWDGMYTVHGEGHVYRRVHCTGTFDAINTSESTRLVIEDSLFSSDGSYGSNPDRAWVAGATTARVLGTRFEVVRGDTFTNSAVVGILAGDLASVKPTIIDLYSCIVSVQGGSGTGPVHAFVIPTQAVVNMHGGLTSMVNIGSGDYAHVLIGDLATEPSSVQFWGTRFNAPLVAFEGTGAGEVARHDQNIVDIKTRAELALPVAAPASNGGLPTVDANNRIAGMQGTINTLDGLGTPQTGDSFAIASHVTHGNAAIKTALDLKASQSSVDDVPTTAEFNARTLAAASYGTAQPGDAMALTAGERTALMLVMVGEDTGETGAADGSAAQLAGQAIVDVIEDLEGQIEPAANVINTDVVDNLVFKLSSRRDGRVWASRPLRLTRGEKATAWIDPTALSGGRSLDNVTGAASDNAELTLVDSGLSRELGVLVVEVEDSDDVDPGDTYEVTFTLHPHGAQTIKAGLVVEIID
jgi:hypothetical protein